MYVAENIGENWLQLLTLLNKRDEISNVIPQDIKGPTDQVIDYFKSLTFQIKWQDLKNALEALGLEEMVDHIEQNTLITQGKFDFLHFMSILHDANETAI